MTTLEDSEDPSYSWQEVADTESAVDEESNLDIDVKVHNVMSNFSTGCHLNLKHVARYTWNVYYHDEKNVFSLCVRLKVSF